MLRIINAIVLTCFLHGCSHYTSASVNMSIQHETKNCLSINHQTNGFHGYLVFNKFQYCIDIIDSLMYEKYGTASPTVTIDFFEGLDLLRKYEDSTLLKETIIAYDDSIYIYTSHPVYVSEGIRIMISDNKAPFEKYMAIVDYAISNYNGIRNSKTKDSLKISNSSINYFYRFDKKIDLNKLKSDQYFKNVLSMSAINGRLGGNYLLFKATKNNRFKVFFTKKETEATIVNDLYAQTFRGYDKPQLLFEDQYLFRYLDFKNQKISKKHFGDYDSIRHYTQLYFDKIHEKRINIITAIDLYQNKFDTSYYFINEDVLSNNKSPNHFNQLGFCTGENYYTYYSFLWIIIVCLFGSISYYFFCKITH